VANCTSDSACGSGRVCDPSGTCATGCASNADCLGGGLCDTASGHCRGVCTSSANCPSSEICDLTQGSPTFGYCEPRCNVDSQCGSGKVCETTSGLCVTACTVEPDGGSSVCATSADGPICNASTGHCGPSCSADADCGSGHYCEPILGKCYASCSASTTCPSGDTCLGSSAPQGLQGHCVFECSQDSDCLAGQRCNQAYGALNGVHPFCEPGQDIALGTYGVYTGSAIAVAPDGNLLVGANRNTCCSLVQYQSDGTYLGYNGAFSSGWTVGLALDPAGNLYLTDQGGLGLLPNAEASTVGGSNAGSWLFQSPNIESPGQIAFDPLGDLFAASTGNNLLKEVTLGSPPAISTFSNQLGLTPTALAVNSQSVVLVGGTKGGAKPTTIDAVDTQGNVTTYATISGAQNLVGFALDGSDNLFATDIDQGIVYRVAAGGAVQSVFADGLYQPWGITTDYNERVVVGQAQSGYVTRFDTFPAAPHVVNVTPLTAAAGATLDIYGWNFDPIQGNNEVEFGVWQNSQWVQATITASNVNHIQVTVPTGITLNSAGTTQIRVSTPNGRWVADQLFTPQ
jgi:hypothetical protein